MIAFDLFGVVFTEGHMVSGTLMPLLPDTAKQSVVKTFYNQYTRGEISEVAFWQGIEQGIKQDTKQAQNKRLLPQQLPQQFSQQLRDDFLKTFVLDEDLIPVLEKLSTHYTLSILSNLAKDWADELTQKHPLLNQYFSPIVISGKVGHEKPHKDIYKILIKQSGLNANEIVFIDDRLENLATAHQLGITTVHYQRELDDFDYKADYKIEKLRDVLVFL